MVGSNDTFCLCDRGLGELQYQQLQLHIVCIGVTKEGAVTPLIDPSKQVILL